MRRTRFASRRSAYYLENSTGVHTSPKPFFGVGKFDTCVPTRGTRTDMRGHFLMGLPSSCWTQDIVKCNGQWTGLLPPTSRGEDFWLQSALSDCHPYLNSAYRQYTTRRIR